MYLRGVIRAGNLPVLADRVILDDVRAPSNLFRGNDGGNVPEKMEYRPARPEEVGDGLSLVLGTPSAPAAADQVAEFAAFASVRGLDVSDLWVAGVSGRMEWAVLPLVSPGRTVLLLTPGALPRGADAGLLVEAVCQWAASRGVHLAQTLVDPSDAAAKRIFSSRGFREIADLLYLQVTPRRNAVPSEASATFVWHTYSPDNHPLFARAIADSYRDSLDCPALDGRHDRRRHRGPPLQRRVRSGNMVRTDRAG